MADSADQPSGHTKRGPLTALVLAAVIGAGLWYWQTRTDTQGPPEPSDTPGATSGAPPASGEPRTTDTGTAGATDSGTTASTDGAQPSDTGTATPPDAAEPASVTRTVGTSSADPPEPTRESGGDTTVLGHAEGAAKQPVLAPAPDGTIGRVPVDAPPGSETAGETAGEAGVLAAVGRVVEHLEGMAKDQLAVDPHTADRATDSGADTEATPPAGAAPSDAAPSTAAAEAEAHVENLTDAAPSTIPVDKADHFVTQDRALSLVPADTIESVSVGELAGDETLVSGSPITVVREVEQIETAVPEQLIAESEGDLETRLRVLVPYDDAADGTAEPGSTGEDATARPDAVEEVTVREVLERIRTEPDRPISLVRNVRFFEVTTLRELLDSEVDADVLLNVVRQPGRLATATLADLLQRKKSENPDTIFYLHTVQATDEQGIWGIVHHALIENFARGVAVGRGQEIETYTVQIPQDADERMEDKSSSFLGRMIDRKTKDSYVYNYRENRMGRNPDRIYPGQEIVIINFEPEELMDIYRHFATSAS